MAIGDLFPGKHMQGQIENKPTKLQCIKLTLKEFGYL